VKGDIDEKLKQLYKVKSDGMSARARLSNTLFDFAGTDNDGRRGCVEAISEYTTVISAAIKEINHIHKHGSLPKVESIKAKPALNVSETDNVTLIGLRANYRTYITKTQKKAAALPTNDGERLKYEKKISDWQSLIEQIETKLNGK
jgi:hypothetical protein